MKLKTYSLILLALVCSQCGPTQKITGSWADPDAANMGPYSKVFVVVLTQNKDNNYFLETQMAKTLISRGYKVVKSNDIYPPSFSPIKDFTKEQLVESINKKGCDCVLSLALLDTKVVESYHPGVTYSPYNYSYYGSFYNYYDYYYTQVYSPGYYSTDKTFYIEANLYDMKSQKLVWSVQSEASNPKSIPDWFKNYAAMLTNHLKTKGFTKNGTQTP
jgi:hypothetical protein